MLGGVGAQTSIDMSGPIYVSEPLLYTCIPLARYFKVEGTKLPLQL